MVVVVALRIAMAMAFLSHRKLASIFTLNCSNCCVDWTGPGPDQTYPEKKRVELKDNIRSNQLKWTLKAKATYFYFS